MTDETLSVKAKASGLALKNMKMTESVSSGVPISVVSRTFVKNVSSCFDWVVPTGTLEIFLRKKS